MLAHLRPELLGREETGRLVLLGEKGQGEWAVAARSIGATGGGVQPGWSGSKQSMDLSWRKTACVGADMTAQVRMQRHDTDHVDDLFAYNGTLPSTVCHCTRLTHRTANSPLDVIQ